MDHQPYEVHVDLANRAALIFSAVMEMLGVGALAIYAAYHQYWQLVVLTVGYVAYVAFKLRHGVRKARVKALADGDGEHIGEPSQDAAPAKPVNWRTEFKWIKSTPSQRKLAGILALVYCALFALAFYLESIKIEDRWPLWILWVGGMLGFGALLVLPFVVVALFFGIDTTFPFLRRFTLRGMLRGMFWASLFIWYCTQMSWVIQRQQWRVTNRGAVRSTEVRPAPPALRLLQEQGESWIEIKNATKEQLAEAKRLFPEATVVAEGDTPVGAQAAPLAAPIQPQPAARE
jgi:hypothetical protein